MNFFKTLFGGGPSSRYDSRSESEKESKTSNSNSLISNREIRKEVSDEKNFISKVVSIEGMKVKDLQNRDVSTVVTLTFSEDKNKKNFNIQVISVLTELKAGLSNKTLGKSEVINFLAKPLSSSKNALLCELSKEDSDLDLYLGEVLTSLKKRGFSAKDFEELFDTAIKNSNSEDQTLYSDMARILNKCNDSNQIVFGKVFIKEATGIEVEVKGEFSNIEEKLDLTEPVENKDEEIKEKVSNTNEEFKLTEQKEVKKEIFDINDEFEIVEDKNDVGFLDLFDYNTSFGMRSIDKQLLRGIEQTTEIIEENYIGKNENPREKAFKIFNYHDASNEKPLVKLFEASNDKNKLNQELSYLKEHYSFSTEEMEILLTPVNKK